MEAASAVNAFMLKRLVTAVSGKPSFWLE